MPRNVQLIKTESGKNRKYDEITSNEIESVIKMGQRRNQRNKKYLETKQMETTYQNLQDAAIAVLRGPYIAINTYTKKKKREIKPNFTPQGRKKEKVKTKVSRSKEITKIRTEIK